jgi:hypothetical protein
MKKLIVSAALVGALFCQVPPASATVHEIVGQWCADRGELLPPGISGSSNADNFARPLNAMGFVVTVPGFDPDGAGPMESGLLITFDFGHPASKIVGTGMYVQIDVLPDGSPVYLEIFNLDTSKGFAHCKALAG